MTVMPVQNSLGICEIASSALITGCAALLLTPIAFVPACIFGASSAVFGFLAKEGSAKILGPDANLSPCALTMKNIICLALPIVGAVALTSLVGFPMTVLTGVLLVVAAAVAQVAMFCLLGAGACCVGAVLSVI